LLNVGCGDDVVNPTDAAVRDAPVDAASADAPAPDAPVDASATDDGGDAAGEDGPLSTSVIVPAGGFMMGCNPAVDTECAADEYPAHAVTLSAFEIDRFEVTQSEYQVCVSGGACTLPAANFNPVATPELPVRDVTWVQARAYCQFRGLRLPTEAEWEKAARGTDGRKYPWGDDPPSCAQANISACGVGLQPVGTHLGGGSFYGVEDQGGNVWEWVADYYDSGYYAQSPAQDPTGPASGSLRAARGGSYATGSESVRASNRVSGDPALAYDDFGLRCARSLP
jgi:formylglycine-generating enzyme required for sulfatase activity